MDPHEYNNAHLSELALQAATELDHYRLTGEVRNQRPINKTAMAIAKHAQIANPTDQPQNFAFITDLVNDFYDLDESQRHEFPDLEMGLRLITDEIASFQKQTGNRLENTIGLCLLISRKAGSHQPGYAHHLAA
tara:strand:+ start:490 stop:891 length:402 start_codon:yes stop_codon:yes gene_type:complete